MDAIYNRVFSLWLSDKQTSKVDAHIQKNFEYAEYEDLSTKTKRLGVINLVTREVMWTDPVPVVRSKCFFVALGNPVHMMCRFGSRLVKGALLVKEMLFNKGDLGKVCTAITELAKVPYYGIGIELAAGVGFFHDPLKGRERIGLIEKMLNGDKGSFLMAPCCQPRVGNIDDDPRYRLVRKARSPEELGYRNPSPAFPLFTEEPQALKG